MNHRDSPSFLDGNGFSTLDLTDAFQACGQQTAIENIMSRTTLSDVQRIVHD
jgi:hypothetical protein